MAKMTLKELEAVVASYVDASKQAGTWSASTNNLAALVDKIAKTITIDGVFADKLPQLDGEELPLGKTVEEYYQDLGSVDSYNDFKANPSDSLSTLEPHYPSYQACSYNYTLGRKIIPTTLKYDEYERACNTPEELAVITNMVLKRLYDTYAQFKYDCKKQIVANAIEKMEAQQDPTNATLYVSGTTVGTVGALLKDGSDNVGIVVKAFTAAAKTFDERVAEGNIVVYDLVEELAIPEDTSTGEAFLESVKKQVEKAEFVGEGNSLNGSAIGAAEGLLLIIKKGIKPVLNVQVEAGCFNPDKLAVPAEIVVVDDIPTTSGKAYAILVDRRALRLHPGYMAVREQMNAAGDFVNYFLHTESTAFIGKNCFMHAWLDD